MPSSDLQSIIDDLSGLLARTPALTQDWASIARWCEHKIDVLSARAGEPGIGPILAALEQAAVALHKAIGDHSSGAAGLAEVHRVGSWWIAETQATGIPQTGAPPAHWSPGGSGSTGGPSGTASPAGPAVRSGPPAPQFRLSRVVTRPGGFSAPSGGYLTAEDLVTSFDPAKDANLPQVTHEDAKKYLEAHRANRPWLDFTANPHPDLDHPDVLRALVAIDQGGGHALSRHEGFAASGDRLRLRVAALEDPAQADPAKRLDGVDAFKSAPLSHVCRTRATAITDPIAFLTAYIHATKHPDVRLILDTGITPGGPRGVSLPLRDLLGANSHRFCAGVQLEPTNADMKIARMNRDRWIQAGRPIGQSHVPEPVTSQVQDFSKAKALIWFGLRPNGRAEIRTVYVEP